VAVGIALGLLLLGGRPCAAQGGGSGSDNTRSAIFARDNLIAWCIVPFDAKKRGPEERAEMLHRLGFKHFAYDWRAEHIPTFDAEVDALKRHGVSLDAFWVAPGELNHESRLILDLLRRHGIKAQLWALLDLGPDRATGAEQERRVEAAVSKLRPLAEEAAKIGCKVGLYNHGGWFGEPENQLAILERLKAHGMTNVGMVYNLHHGHEHLDRFPELLTKIRPHLLALNLNGMDPGGDQVGRKILPLGQGERDLDLLRTIRDSGYRGLIGILGHTMDDAEDRLRDNLDGLDWLLPQLAGKPAGPPPRPRTPVPPRPASGAANGSSGEAREAAALVAEALKEGDPRRGAEVFLSPRFGCTSCHRIGTEGGTVGPDLSAAGVCLPPEEVAESILWPRKKVKEGYAAVAVSLDDGRIVQGYPIVETDAEVHLRETTTGELVKLARTSIEETRNLGTLMPERLAETMSPRERRDLLRFVLDLGKPGSSTASLVRQHPHGPVSFPYERAPLRPEQWPNWQARVNRDRIYDFYAKEAEYFRKQRPVPLLLPQYPGLDGGTLGHWGNQNEDSWSDGRWNQTSLGSLLCGVFRGAGVTVPKGVCVRLGEQGEQSVCFNPESLNYEALWRGGFVRFSATRHGFLDGLVLDGEPLPRPEGANPGRDFRYHGFYRHGSRVVFAYERGGVEYLDSPWVEDGRFTRRVARADDPSLARFTRGGPSQWPQVLETRLIRGQGRPYAIDTIELPFRNPWDALLFFGDHDFLPDGSAMLCTMQGDVWHVTGLDDDSGRVHWRRFASGLHQAQGLRVVDGLVCVLGRDQITRLHDLNGDGEADFYECVSNAYVTSPAGHDFICGLQRDTSGSFYTVSGKQGLIRISPDGKSVQVVATGFRNPDGLGLLSGGELTVPNSEGDWIPASMVCEVKPGGHYGYGGPRNGQPPDLPLVYLPRGLDNSSSAQVEVTSDRWGPLQGQLLHLSFGSGTHFLLLRERVDGQPQGAAVPLPGEFLSGIHRGRFNPSDGQLYVSGMAGWGTYTPDDGCFQRVRYTGGSVQLPVAFHAHENGVAITFSRPVERAFAEEPSHHFAQVWNYRYSGSYGSPELSTRHPGVPGHDPLEIRSAHVLADGRTLFLELPDLQPVNQLHLHVRPEDAPAVDLFATVHKLASPFTGFPGYRPSTKTIAAHPILADMAAMNAPRVPNPWREKLPRAREVHISAGKNLSYTVASFKVRAGEPIKLTFSNPDVVPHNWTLARPGTLAKVGDLVNKIIAEPDAAARHYIPRGDDILVYTDIVEPGRDSIVFFQAPSRPGRYPYLCTFPGHWMVMNGVMIVE
jgi:putative heme-binding domain-containing protein